jgi:hypothetical protein
LEKLDGEAGLEDGWLKTRMILKWILKKCVEGV